MAEVGSGPGLLDLSAHVCNNYTVHPPSFLPSKYVEKRVAIEVGKAWSKISAL